MRRRKRRATGAWGGSLVNVGRNASDWPRHICDDHGTNVPPVTQAARSRVCTSARAARRRRVNQLSDHNVISIDQRHDRTDAALAARICWYYFKEGQTQDAIAQHLKITRKRVNRILKEARESGLVQITIAPPVGPCSELEARLVAAFGLRQ